ncbi:MULTISPECIES: DNA-binding protein [Paraburkholderia]|uniref:DNA-binding protein n=1 Tax=Paraburkholderia TaxID=1822464 RepID=UPI000364A6D9|nr:MULTISPECIES: DNA-binding protein [Paraburkholderia]MDH6153668.1 chromosome segregation ATPase [Paraburkholderia sp. WSM4179]
MSRISDTRLRTREAAARLVGAGRLPHELTVDLIYAEIRQGSRTTINDELKLWKDEQARNDALAAALPPPVASAMLSVWALAIEHGEAVFAQRGEELEREVADATARAESLETAHAALEAQARSLRSQLDDREARLATATTELARAQAGGEAAVREVQIVAAERDAARADAEEAQRTARVTNLRELEALRAEHAEREAALRAQVDQAAVRLEGVQKRVMLQTEEARNAQRRAEAAVAKIQQRNEQLVGEVQRLTADAGEQRRLAERHEKQLASVMDEARELRRERVALAQQVALLQGQLAARAEPVPARATRRSRQAT